MPLFLISLPLSFEGEGDKGGEVDKQSMKRLDSNSAEWYIGNNSSVTGGERWLTLRFG